MPAQDSCPPGKWTLLPQFEQTVRQIYGRRKTRKYAHRQPLPFSALCCSPRSSQTAAFHGTNHLPNGSNYYGDTALELWRHYRDCTSVKRVFTEQTHCVCAVPTMWGAPANMLSPNLEQIPICEAWYIHIAIVLSLRNSVLHQQIAVRLIVHLTLSNPSLTSQLECTSHGQRFWMPNTLYPPFVYLWNLGTTAPIWRMSRHHSQKPSSKLQ